MDKCVLRFKPINPVLNKYSGEIVEVRDICIFVVQVHYSLNKA